MKILYADVKVLPFYHSVVGNVSRYCISCWKRIVSKGDNERAEHIKIGVGMIIGMIGLSQQDFETV